VEEFHRLFVIDPSFLLDAVFFFEAVDDFLHQSVERFGLKTYNIEAVTEFWHRRKVKTICEVGAGERKI
jgi:hypothetical protein